jgi:hypothetical protein
MLAVSYTLMATFSFSGPGWKGGNFGWAYSISLTFAYLYTVRDYLALSLNGTLRRWQHSLLQIIFVLCLVSGLFLWHNYFTNTHFWILGKSVH